jgi:GNAT superfamily N-acetyltransferase
MNESQFHIRTWSDQDSIEELTEVLHHSYKQLKDRGYHSVATHQSPEITAERIAKGKCLVAIFNNRIIGTLTYIPVGKVTHHKWYAQPHVGVCSQFGVIPELQGLGIGTALLKYAEQFALEDGATELALDTVGEAHDLIEYYIRRGFRKVGEAKWDAVNYRSVILSKTISEFVV